MTLRKLDFSIERAEIISVGTELLLGQTVDTNAHFLSGHLTELGISTYRHTVVGDNVLRLEEAIRSALAENDLVILTGGLGPTADDVTAAVAARVAGVGLVQDLAVNQALDERYPGGVYGGFAPYPELPEGAVALINENGTAPGSFLTLTWAGKRRALLLLPGPPQEMEPMFLSGARELLESASGYRFIHRYVRLFGLGESEAEGAVRDLIEGQGEVTVAPYASPTELVFRISQKLDRGGGEDRTGPVVEALRSRLGKYIFEIGPRRLEQVLLDLLIEKSLSCAFAESCTAGLAAASLASVPGASQALAAAFVTYQEAMKTRLLGVPQAILREEGPVSRGCALAMVEGCLERTGADLALAITGIAGPSGGREGLPVGTVWLASAGKGMATEARHYHFPGNRDRVRLRAVYTGFDLLRRRLLEL